MGRLFDALSRGFADLSATLALASARGARLVVAVSIVLTVVTGWYTVANISINTDDTDMLSAELPFRKRAEEIRRAFPDQRDTIVVVIDAADAGIADEAAGRLAEAFRKQPAVFGRVSDLAGSDFFRRNALLFLDPQPLDDVLDRLAQAQPFLGSLAQDPSLRGFLSVLSQAVEEKARGNDAAAFDLTPVLTALAKVAEQRLDGRTAWFPWRSFLTGEGALASGRRMIVLEPVVDYGSLMPAEDAMDAVRDAARGLGYGPESGVTVRLTGSAALASEELASVGEGMGLATILSFAMVAGLLLFGMKSPRRVFAVMVPLVFGLIWTTAFAVLAVGQLNLISVAFAVLFIGLADNFGIQFALRYDEEIGRGADRIAAAEISGRHVGGALLLSALTAAIGFMSFLPTVYRGLAELGLIAGAGMFIALVANLTLLPAVLALQTPGNPGPPATPSEEGFYAAIGRHARLVCGGAIVVGIAALTAAPFARFDFDPMNLKDPTAESVATLFDLMADGDATPYTIEILARDLGAADAMASKLKTLRTVKSARTLNDYVPGGQGDKGQAIESTALFLLPSLEGATATEAPGDDAQVEAVRQTILRLAESPAAGEEGQAVQRLRKALERTAAAGPEAIRALQSAVVRTLPGTLDMLRSAMSAAPFHAEDLPGELRDRLVAANGQARVEVTPRIDARDPQALRAFVAEVRTVAPDAAGTPVVIVEAGRAVISAFAEAGTIALVGIALVLAVVLRRARSVLLVLAPVFLAGALTLVASVAFDLPFNFANVIVLPLLFGLGVASSIDLVHREDEEKDAAATMASSTPRAVLYSALTTIGSFATMALSGHSGTASMGVLLTIAISLTIVCTLVVLPALMTLFPPAGGRS